MLARFVAEIGCNHMGSVELAKQMVVVAARCGVDFAKFQKRTNRELLSPDEYAAPHPCEANAFGNSYGEHRDFLEFDIETHAMLKDFCASQGIGYASSVWDTTSARQIAGLKPDYIKIPSAMNCCWQIYDAILDAGFQGDLHVSLGMTSRDEERELVRFLQYAGVFGRTVFYHCTSAYPAQFRDLCLLEIARLRRTYPDNAIGYSGHHMGIAADVSAITLGASIVERHFTVSRSLKGTDHAASLEPEEMARVIRDAQNIAAALDEKRGAVIPGEEEQRAKLKRFALWGQEQSVKIFTGERA